MLILLAFAVAINTRANPVLSYLVYETDYAVVPPVDTIPKGRKGGKLIIPDSLRVMPIDSNSVVLPNDSIITDSIYSNLDTIRPLTPDEMMYEVSADSFDADVQYNANDSLIYDILDEKVHLYGNAVVKYKDLTLEAHYIQLDWANNMVIAQSKLDSLGNPVEKAKFKDATSEYQAKTIMYNFKTKKGKRCKGIVEELGKRDYNIIVFQEAFKMRSRRKIYKGLKAKYPYHYGPANRKFSWRTNSGIWVLSDRPLSVKGEVEFTECANDGCLARKGGLMVEGEHNGHIFQIVILIFLGNEIIILPLRIILFNSIIFIKTPSS